MTSLGHRLPEPRTRVLVVGKSGTGKSSAVKDALRSWTKRGVRVVALDCADEYSRHGRETGLVRLGPLRDRVTASQLAASPGLLTARRLSLAVVPDAREPRAWAAAFLLLSRLVPHAGRLVLVADEVQTWADSSVGPAGHAARTALAGLAVYGRHDGVALVLVSQRASGVPPGARSQVTDVLAFKQDEPADLAALAERLGPARAARVARLAVGESVPWRDDDEDATTEAAPTLTAAPTLKAV